jgi:hypothetical protein
MFIDAVAFIGPVTFKRAVTLGATAVLTPRRRT